MIALALVLIVPQVAVLAWYWRRTRRISPAAAYWRHRFAETPFLTDAEMEAERERDAMAAMHVRQVRDARLRGAL